MKESIHPYSSIQFFFFKVLHLTHRWIMVMFHRKIQCAHDCTLHNGAVFIAFKWVKWGKLTPFLMPHGSGYAHIRQAYPNNAIIWQNYCFLKKNEKYDKIRKNPKKNKIFTFFLNITYFENKDFILCIRIWLLKILNHCFFVYFQYFDKIHKIA